jgi:hypothetical protein
MAEMRASPVVNPRLKRIAEVLADLQGPMGQIIPFTDVNPFKVLMPQASTFENLAYGNSPFSEYAGVTNRRLPIVKTGRENELTDIADVALMATGFPTVSKGVTRGANFLGDVLTQAVTRNPNATSMMALDEIARMSPVSQIAPKPPTPQPVRSDLGFYSQLEAATLPLQNKGTGQQYLAQIQKSAGVKPEEIQWTGLDTFLQGRQSVTKQEIQDYLNANRVDVQEVRLGENFAPGYQFSTYNEWENALDQAEAAGDVAEVSRLNEWAKLRYDTPNQTKFSSYTLPGGENYREILLTLPDTKGARLDARRAEIEAKGRNATDAEKQEWSSIMNQLQPETRDVEGLSPFRNRPEFRSTHFDQPNILAHMRVNDRVVDGKKTLFVEEIQSDWHQAGRKKGYAQQLKPEQLKASEVLPKQPGPRTWTVTYPNGNTATFAGNSADDAISAAVARESKIGVPDAPFKTSWHELSLKRAIQEAAEKGYDQIAFTTGKTQAERYDLSKQIDRIELHQSEFPNKQTRPYYLTAFDKNGRRVLDDTVAESNIEEYIGKEAASKVLSMKADPSGVRVLEGADLQVGGEGMKGFYDNILPKSLDKLGKKFDAKVGKTEMDGVEVWQMDIAPQMRESVTTKGQPLFAIPTIGAAALGASMYDQDPLEQFLNYQ